MIGKKFNVLNSNEEVADWLEGLREIKESGKDAIRDISEEYKEMKEEEREAYAEIPEKKYGQGVY